MNIFLKNDKEVYLQGYLENEEQNLDIKVKFPIRLKSLFEIYGIKFEKIYCGLTHVLLLTSDNNVLTKKGLFIRKWKIWAVRIMKGSILL